MDNIHKHNNCINIMSRVRCVRDLLDGFRFGWLDLLIPYTFHSELQAIAALSLFPHFTGHCCKHTMVLSLHSSLVVCRQRIHNSLNVNSNHTWSPLCTTQLLSCHYSQSPSAADSLNSLLQLPTPEFDSILLTTTANYLNSNSSCVRSSLYVQPRGEPTENAACNTYAIVAWCHIVRDALLCCLCTDNYLATAVSLPLQFLLGANTPQYPLHKLLDLA
jgi:hypothetical protein